MFSGPPGEMFFFPRPEHAIINRLCCLFHNLQTPPPPPFPLSNVFQNYCSMFYSTIFINKLMIFIRGERRRRTQKKKSWKHARERRWVEGNLVTSINNNQKAHDSSMFQLSCCFKIWEKRLMINTNKTFHSRKKWRDDLSPSRS